MLLPRIEIVLCEPCTKYLVRHFINEDLPQPESPITATTELQGMVKLSYLTISLPDGSIIIVSLRMISPFTASFFPDLILKAVSISAFAILSRTLALTTEEAVSSINL